MTRPALEPGPLVPESNTLINHQATVSPITACFSVLFYFLFFSLSVLVFSLILSVIDSNTSLACTMLNVFFPKLYPFQLLLKFLSINLTVCDNIYFVADLSHVQWGSPRKTGEKSGNQLCLWIQNRILGCTQLNITTPQIGYPGKNWLPIIKLQRGFNKSNCMHWISTSPSG